MTTQVELKKAILLPNGNTQAVDYSGTINLIPRNWGLIENLGLFTERFGTQKEFYVGRKEEIDSPLLEDRNWEGTRPSLTRGEFSGVTFKIPHFPVDDMILPNDIDGRIQMTDIGAGSELETVARVRAEKMEKLRRAHARTHEYARAVALATGNVYAPTGTLRTSYGQTVNVYNEWGITRQTSELRLGAGVNPQDSVAELFGEMEDASFQGDPIDGYAVLASPELFNALVSNDFVREIYSVALLTGREELLVGRLGNELGLDARYRTFRYAGVLFIEYRGTINGLRYIPANEGIAIPMMRGLGRMHFAPANKFGDINGVAQASYVWEYMGLRNDKIEIETETNFATILDRPDLVRTVTMNLDPATP